MPSLRGARRRHHPVLLRLPAGRPGPRLETAIAVNLDLPPPRACFHASGPGPACRPAEDRTQPRPRTTRALQRANGID
ncbi:MAG: hypothetical protein GYB51_17820 [Rhodobacteraceae bacterium]|nr:hypothetical protein [Paracoccaceae bacterium]